MVHKFNIINCIRITYVIYMLLDVMKKQRLKIKQEW